MKMAVLGSMRFHKQMIEAKERLENMGHEIFLPHVEHGDFHEMRRVDAEKWKNLKPGFMKDHFGKIRRSDAVLVLNYDKDGLQNYIGGNTIMEIGIAFYLGKRIFLLNPIPAGMAYTEELLVINPVVLDGDLHNLEKHLQR